MASDSSAADYLERLKVLRARCGLDNEAAANTAAARSTDAGTLSDVNKSHAPAAALNSVDAVSTVHHVEFCIVSSPGVVTLLSVGKVKW